MSRRLAPLALLLLLVLPSVASADTTWTRVSSVTPPGGAGGQSLEWTMDASGVVGVWTVAAGTKVNLEVVRFTSSRAAEAAGITAQVPPTLAGWDFMDATVLPQAAGGTQALVTGQFGVQTGPPSGTNLVPLNGDGSVGALTLLNPGTPDMLNAVLTTAGPLWAGNSGSTLYSYTPLAHPAFTFTDPAGPIQGCCGYIPRLGFDRAGRLWVALYSNATNQVGIWMGQLDPATGVLLGAMQKAPQSESSDNNGRKLAFACADVCRVAYEETDTTLILASGRLVTWAYGEGAPTVVGGSLGARTSAIALASRADGRLWVTWIDSASGHVMAKLGDARGAGGRVVDNGTPVIPQPGFLNGLDVLPLGDDLLINVNADQGQPNQAQFVNLVLAPGAVDTGDVPNPKIVTSPGGKLVYPGTVTGRCVRVRPVADKPARIWAQVFSGRKNGSPVSNRVLFRFTAPGAKSKCVTLQAKPKGFYTGKVYRIKFEVRTGANAKPIEKTRPPWRTQPQIKITL